MIRTVKLLTAPGVALEFSDGSRLGTPADPQDVRIAAGNLRRLLARQTSAWPQELAAFETTQARHALLKAWHQTGTEQGLLTRVLGPAGTRLPLTPLLKPYILTNALGSSLDGTFTTLLPVGSEVPQTLEIQSESDRGSRSWQVSTQSYLEAIHAFLHAIEQQSG